MRKGAALLGALALALSVAAPVRAAGPEIDGSSATARFGEVLEFRADVRLDGPLRRAEILLEFEGGIGPYLREVQVASGSGAQTLVFRWSFTEDGHVYPNTRIRASWRLTPGDGTAAVTGGATTITYADDRYQWRTRTSSLVRLHWYAGDDAFAEHALSVAQDGVRQAQDLLGVSETDPVDVFIYASSSAMYGALGPGTRENVGATALPWLRTLVADIPPGTTDDLLFNDYIPHELTHLVFATATKNPYNGPPRWLNEGVAQYVAQGYQPADRAEVRAAVDDDRVIPLTALGGLFPTTHDPFYLAYAESISAVHFMVATYGRDALVALIRSYATGVTDDEAFRAAIGTDVAGFEAAWLADLGAKVPKQYGPQPAPAGPLPSGWDAPPPGEASPAPGTPAAPSAAASSEPAASAPAASPTPAGNDAGGGPGPLVVAGIAVAIAAAAVLGILVLRRRA